MDLSNTQLSTGSIVCLVVVFLILYLLCFFTIVDVFLLDRKYCKRIKMIFYNK